MTFGDERDVSGRFAAASAPAPHQLASARGATTRLGLPLKTTSSTAPDGPTRPLAAADVKVTSGRRTSAALRIQGVRSGDDLEDLLRDLRLPRAVHLERQRVDELAGALRRASHRRHARALLGGRRLEQRAVELRLEVDREQAGEDLLRLGLVDEVAPKRTLLALLLL